MNLFHLKTGISALIICLFIANYSFAQQGTVSINQDEAIITLLNLKKEINKESNNYYKIQIYSGNRSSAEAARKNFNSKYYDWTSKIVYETPNFKIWAGNFRTRLEADRALKKIKREFPSAFVFKPKKEKS
ncbi:SPOR domain-containing protein [uncultured Algibacter sp.]|uniref:SPOR domain-containing protein n=1 Tax=uncultured Algibacter sp. TaxID=298659 RepID=UPI00260B7CA6|nr:SPOR domain-containing protein [uncultured Algibacter sp.]